ncbi:hypothetical protein HMPREF0645_1799 [Hallella bergensis DSM 17361]|uniref:Uncharacterized protein n=1 Tax=Hallella bergensis DSM 17361 TaxID=585502 RepID=D1PXW4_9BACT|nr:hypothetical protein HMPREF0645_1799 [Hallella bergensis DSM 17361]
MGVIIAACLNTSSAVRLTANYKKLHFEVNFYDDKPTVNSWVKHCEE